MRLTHIHPGDIVRVDDGLPYHAVVLARERGRLRVRMLGRAVRPAHRAGGVGGRPLAPRADAAHEPRRRRSTMSSMAVEIKKLDLQIGDVVEIDARRYEVVPDGHGGLALEPAITTSAAELDRRHGTRPATQEEIDSQLDLLPGDGEG